MVPITLKLNHDGKGENQEGNVKLLGCSRVIETPVSYSGGFEINYYLFLVIFSWYSVVFICECQDGSSNTTA
jgi:hypothetical protein